MRQRQEHALHTLDKNKLGNLLITVIFCAGIMEDHSNHDVTINRADDGTYERRPYTPKRL
jgi:hypothetical protein